MSYPRWWMAGSPSTWFLMQLGMSVKFMELYETLGVELRGQFIIDPDGITQAMEVLTPPVGRSLAETVRQIKAFQQVRATQGKEATPAGWEPGQLTLTPDPGLVGRVWEVWQPSQER